MCRREDGRRTARDRPHATCSNSRQQTTAGHRRTTSHLGGVTCNNQCTTGKMKQVQEAAPEEADAHVSAGRRAQGAYACRCVTGPVQRATRTVQRATDDVSSVAHHAPRAIQCASTRSRRACAAGMVWHCGEADVATWTPSNVQRAVCNMQRAACNMQHMRAQRILHYNTQQTRTHKTGGRGLSARGLSGRGAKRERAKRERTKRERTMWERRQRRRAPRSE